MPAGKLDTIAGTAKAHRGKAAAAAGAVVVVFLGLRARGKSTGAAGGPAEGATIAGYAPAGATGAAGSYDSTGTDVYNALQPQVEQTQSMLAQLLERLSPGQSLPTGAAATVAKWPNDEPSGWTGLPSSAPAAARVPTPAVTPRPAPAPAAPVKAPSKAPSTVYTVRKGDTLSAIAKAQGVGSWSTLYAANRGVIGSNPNVIKPGQRLTIPGR